MRMDDDRFSSSPEPYVDMGLGPINVGEAERIPSLVVGAVLALLGLNRGSLVGGLLALVGGELLYRGATGHCPVYQSLGMNTADVAQPKRVAVKPNREERVEEASWESFPASDAPSWSGGAIT